MGTVNLMEKPEIHFRSFETEHDPPVPGAGPSTYSHWFKLNQTSVKLLLNPSSDLQIEEISGALVFEGVEDNGYFPIHWDNVVPGTNGLDVVSPMIRSRIVPLGCLPDMTIWINHAAPIEESDVFLKLYVNLERENADPNTQNVLFVAKYPVKLVDTYDTSFDWSSPYDGYQARDTLNVSSGAITSDINAWESVVIENGTTFQPGTSGARP